MQSEFESAWERAFPWTKYLLEEVEKHRGLWEGVYARSRVPEWALAEAAELPAARLLVLSEDWCGDAANTVPVIARLAEQVPQIEMRVIKRDENPELMDQFLTAGARSIPLAIVLNESFAPIGRWGPRPAELQHFVLREKREGIRPSADIYRDVRTWYARDRGGTTIRELLGAVRNGLAPERTGDPR